MVKARTTPRSKNRIAKLSGNGKGKLVAGEDKKCKEKRPVIQIEDLNLLPLTLWVIGGEPGLMMNQFPFEDLADIQEELERKPEEPKKKKKPALKPMEKATRARFVNGKGEDCIPSYYFKASMGNAVSLLPGNEKGAILSKAKFRGGIHMVGFLLPLRSIPWELDTRPVKAGGKSGGRVPSHRPLYRLWGCELKIEYDADLFVPKTIVSLLLRAGVQCGVGPYRINCNGPFGSFRPVGDLEFGEYLRQLKKINGKCRK